VLLANDGDRVITSDPDDLAPLARAADVDIELVTPVTRYRHFDGERDVLSVR